MHLPLVPVRPISASGPTCDKYSSHLDQEACLTTCLSLKEQERTRTERMNAFSLADLETHVTKQSLRAMYSLQS